MACRAGGTKCPISLGSGGSEEASVSLLPFLCSPDIGRGGALRYAWAPVVDDLCGLGGGGVTVDKLEAEIGMFLFAGTLILEAEEGRGTS